MNEQTDRLARYEAHMRIVNTWVQKESSRRLKSGMMHIRTLINGGPDELHLGSLTVTPTHDNNRESSS
jgi:alpha-D-ribose 1-methylphosphonate 5-triphosphate synthase subunit PhnG